MTSDFIALAFASEFTAHHYWLNRPSDEESGPNKIGTTYLKQA